MRVLVFFMRKIVLIYKIKGKGEIGKVVTTGNKNGNGASK
jgi:hypothetical protein